MTGQQRAPRPALWAVLDRFLADELPLDELGQLVRDRAELVAALTPAERSALERIDFASRAAAPIAHRLVQAIYDAHRPRMLARDRAERIARGMVSGDIDVAAGTRALARMHEAGESWIPEAFVALAAALDDLPHTREHSASDWRALAHRLGAARQQARSLRAPALTAARRLLERVDTEPADSAR